MYNDQTRLALFVNEAAGLNVLKQILIFIIYECLRNS